MNLNFRDIALAAGLASAIAMASAGEAAAIGPQPQIRGVAVIRIDTLRPSDIPGAPHSLGNPERRFMLAPAQPETPTAGKKLKRSRQ